MYQNKRGFTLIEVLSVIVILAIISLIATPIILNIISNANKNAFKDTAYRIIDAGELYYVDQLLKLDEMNEDTTFEFPNNIGTMKISGKLPNGKIMINTHGDISLALTNGTYCITKRYSDLDITITEDSENCKLPSNNMTNTEKTLSELVVTNELLGVIEIAECVEKWKVCAVNKTNPISFAIKVNKNDIYKFYVIHDTGDEITLIMNRNLGNNLEWINEEDYTNANSEEGDNTICSSKSCNDEGPISAINQLDELTDDEWTDIPMRDYVYIDNNGGNKYNSFSRTMRARFLTYEEATSTEIGCILKTNESCPPWLYINLKNSGEEIDSIGKKRYGYWLSDTAQNSSTQASMISFYGYVNNTTVSTAGYYGIRPVIVLKK